MDCIVKSNLEPNIIAFYKAQQICNINFVYIVYVYYTYTHVK